MNKSNSLFLTLWFEDILLPSDMNKDNVWKFFTYFLIENSSLSKIITCVMENNGYYKISSPILVS
jgi:hypothetical protein